MLSRTRKRILEPLRAAFERVAGAGISFALGNRRLGKSDTGRFSSSFSGANLGFGIGAVLAAAMLMSTAQNAQAGDFTLNWGGTHNWPTNSTGPNTFTMTDQYGFQLQARGSVARIGGSAYAGTPDDLFTFAGNTFGSEFSIWLVWDANSGSSGVGESTNTATLEFLSGGSPFAVDGLSFRVSDIDPVDNNSSTDRCDFVTLTGNAGNPALTYVSPTAASRSVRIGPGAGSGATGALAANQAQCIYNTGSTGSNSSDGDDFGSILATYPAGTSVATIAYDESIENVYGSTSRDASARGVGIWAATAITVNQSISLAKTTAATSYSTLGQTITYTYTITNNGKLPINTGQNIQIQDDKIGTFTCGTISSPIPVGGTHVCNANYIVTALDMLAANITNNAVAGVGTGAQSFATRLQSNSSQVVLPRSLFANLVTVKTLSSADPTPSEGDTVTFLITVTNNGPDTAGSTTLTDLLPAGMTAAAGNGAVSQGSYAAGTGVWSIGTIPNGASATLTLEGTVNAGQAGNIITNTTTAATSNATDPTNAGNDLTESVTVNNFDMAVTKNVDLADVTAAGATLNYTITVTNTGNAAMTGVSPVDTLTQGAGNTPLTLSGPSGDGGVAGTLEVAEVWTYTASHVVTQTEIDDGNDLVNGIVVSTTEMGAATRSASATTTVSPTHSVSVTKVPDIASVNNAGDVITYTITVMNTGTATLTGINVSDPLLSGISCVPGSGGSPNNLAPGASATCTGTYAAIQNDFDTNGGGDGDIDNTVTVTANAGVNQTASAAVTLNLNPDLTVTKTADDTTDVVVGQAITYTYTVENTGNQTITNVSLSDAHGGSGPAPTPSNETLSTDNAPLGDSTDAGTDGTWDTIAPGDIVTFTATYTVTQNDVDTLQ